MPGKAGPPRPFGQDDVDAEETIGGETTRGGDRVNVTDAGSNKGYDVRIHLK